MRLRVTLAAVVGSLFALFVAGAQAQSATGVRESHIHGIVFAHGSRGGGGGGGVSNLSYHGGPVMPANQVYAIFWVPSGYSVDASGAGYQQTIDSFFTNVAHDSLSASNPPLQTNVYWSDTQYYQSTPSGNQSIQYNSTFGGEIDDTSAYPANGCRDRYTKVCLTDGQLQTEIGNVLAGNSSLPTGGGAEYFLFTPKNVGSCFGSSCAYSYFCAYHSNFATTGGQEVLYANMPYDNWVAGACGTGQKPNGNDADSTINVTSHEHNETITDPLGSSWFDSSGNEDGDKCAWNFGSGSQIQGSTGAKYNQTINGAHYYLQQEWSNHSSGCVLSGT